MNGHSSSNNGAHFFSVNSAMESTGYKVFNDSVHGHITLHPLLVKVVDTPEFQRLRNIRQLGSAHFVYPGAVHSRFEHSLGTCYLAGQMVEKLMKRKGIEDEAAEAEASYLALCVQVAALCHDLGHGPFSHLWEDVLKLCGKHWKHEQSSVEMFDYLVKANNLTSEFEHYGIKSKELHLIKELIMGGPSDGEQPILSPENNYLYEIVSNKSTGIDVDKWDYFLRDGLHLNIRITFDYRRLLEFCKVQKDNKGCTYIAFRDKEMLNLYDVFRVRSALHHTAYKHRAVVCIDLMVIDAFKAACDAGYRINNSEILLMEAHTRPEHMRELTDHVFYDILHFRDTTLTPDAKSFMNEAKQLLERIHRRELYTFVEKVNIQIPENLRTVEQRRDHVEEQRVRLCSQLEKLSQSLQFRVRIFYLDLDTQHDPISKVKFYGKESGNDLSIDNIRAYMDTFPFQLKQETTATLLVFCTSASTILSVEEKKNVLEARIIIKEFKGLNK